MTTYLVIALTLVIVAQTALLLRVWPLLQRPARTEDRLAHFAEALALLTDTTEAGLANVALELESTRRRTPRGTSRAATAKRIATAARKGQSIEDIVAAEALSESEIRLHLRMTANEIRLKDGGPNGAVLG
jgi:alkylhydroperoxidase family enzyme